MNSRFRKIAENIEWVYCGPELRPPFATILNSHQSRFPRNDHPWVAKSLQAVDFLKSLETTMIGSVGLNSYELPLWYAGQSGMNLIVAAPLKKLNDVDAQQLKITRDFELQPDRTGFLFFKSLSQNRKAPDRDRLILLLSDKIYPVSIRPKGRIQSLLNISDKSKIDRRFQVPFKNHRHLVHIPEYTVSNQEFVEWSRLTHWTRSVPGPFPGETPGDYYRDVIQTHGEYARSGLHALARMLNMGCIKGSKAGIRGGYRIVSFTELPPIKALALMQRNQSRMRLTFEPYGVAIHRDVLENIGARPAIYAPSHDFEAIPIDQRPFFQAQGKNNRWLPEKEWRIHGDVSLESIPDDQILALTADQREARQLAGMLKRPGIVCHALSGE